MINFKKALDNDKGQMQFKKKKLNVEPISNIYQ